MSAAARKIGNVPSLEGGPLSGASGSGVDGKLRALRARAAAAKKGLDGAHLVKTARDLIAKYEK